MGELADGFLSTRVLGAEAMDSLATPAMIVFIELDWCIF